MKRSLAIRAGREDVKRAGFFDRFFLEIAGLVPRASDLHIGGLLLLGGTPPPFPVLRDYLAGQAAKVPVLGYRLTGTKRGGWEPAPEFDPLGHVAEARLAPGTDVLAAGLTVMERPLPSGRPLWELVMLHGYAEDEYALCYRAHHAFQDGVGLVHTAAALLSDSGPEGTWQGPASARGRSALWTWRTLTDHGVPLSRAADWAPFSSPLTGRRVLLPVRLDARPLNAVAAATGATVHQACLAVLTGAIRDLAPLGEVTDRRAGRRFQIAVPLNLRTADELSEPGNYLGLLRVSLPCAEPSPVRQLERIVAQTGRARMIRHRELHRRALDVLPYPAAKRLMQQFAERRYITMAVSTLRVEPAALGGTVIRGLYAFPPLLPGHHGMIIILQQPDNVTFSLLFDESVAGVERLPGLIERSADRLHQAATS
ncbi:wax ester/triacylglycerol synthase domain-containing protein [Spirillospora sp. CA-253888]